MVADLDGVIISQVYGDNSGGAEFDTDGDGTATQEDEFVSLQNTTGAPIDLSGWQIWSDMAGAGAPDSVQDGLYHTFPPGTSLGPGDKLFVVNEISGTPAPNMQEASEGGTESGAGGINTNFLTEGDGPNGAEGVALVNPATGEYIVIDFSQTALSDFTGMSGFPGTTEVARTNAATQSGVEDQNAGSSYQYNEATDSYEYAAVAVTCFGAGTRVAVVGGERAVDELRPGDLVLTLDHGVQRLKRCLKRYIDFAWVGNRCNLPIVFEKGSLGPNVPVERLVVSPQHRILVCRAAGSEVLVPAKALTGRKGVRVMNGCRAITYYHLVFERHEIVQANGCWSESFYPGAYATMSLGPKTQMALRGIFPDLKHARPVKAARPLVRVVEGRSLCKRETVQPLMRVQRGAAREGIDRALTV